MILVSKVENRFRTTVTVDGRLAGDGIGVVESCCNQAIRIGKPVRLFLRDVPVIDQDGGALLCRLAAKGVHLLASGIYTSYVVQALHSSKGPTKRAATGGFDRWKSISTTTRKRFDLS